MCPNLVSVAELAGLSYMVRIQEDKFFQDLACMYRHYTQYYELILHQASQYNNTPIQYTVIFHGFKDDYFQMKNCDIFHMFALLHISLGGSNEYHRSMF